MEYVGSENLGKTLSDSSKNSYIPVSLIVLSSYIQDIEPVSYLQSLDEISRYDLTSLRQEPIIHVNYGTSAEMRTNSIVFQVDKTSVLVKAAHSFNKVIFIEIQL